MKLILLLVLSGSAISQPQSDDVLELVNQNGFTGEGYNVQTEDGYILRLHRILPSGNSVPKHPVFLMHGMLVSSSAFVMSSSENSLGFLLADSGYDVWMGNTRGTKFSTNHTTLSTESSEFWTFSFHEMGFYDLPAMIDLMLEKTGAEKFFYISHSQGSTALLVFLSMSSEYNKKLAQAHLTAPAVFSNNIKHPFIRTAFSAIKSGIFRTSRYLNMKPGWELLQGLFCSQLPGTLEFAICEAYSLITAGPNGRMFQMDKKASQKYIKFMSPRMSVMQIVHYAQIHYSRTFQTFDHSWENFEKEIFIKPVEYNLSKVITPLYLYAGGSDALVGNLDTETLRNLLPNVIKLHVVDDWNHFDFTYATNASLYKQIIKELERYEMKNFN